jgi:hypothetical protein
MASGPDGAAETPGAAARCRTCGSDPAAPPLPRRSRARLLGMAALFAAGMAALSVIARPMVERWRAERCQPTNLTEWHAAMRRQCLTAGYVCENMTTRKMLEDPEIATAIRGDSHGLADLVGRMRESYGCSPEPLAPLEPEVIGPPPIPQLQDRPRSL